MKLDINLGKYKLKALASFSKIRKEETIGYTNRCKDGKFIIFLDYDRTKMDWIINELEHLQDMYMLGDFHLFESSKDSFHAVCFDKAVLEDLIEIMRNTSIDPNYIRIPLYCGKKIWTLRLTDKKKPIKYLGKFESPHNHARPKSTAHINVVNSLFKLDLSYENEDKEEKVVLSRYPL